MDSHFKKLNQMETFKESLQYGIMAGLKGPVPVLIAGMIGFGAMGHGAGLSLFQSTMISFAIYALPGQIVFVEMMMMGSIASAIALAVAFTSTRFLTMTLTLFPQIPKSEKEPSRFLSVHLVAMSAWTYCMNDFPKIKPELRYAYFLGIGLICWLISIPATMLGYFLADLVPDWISYALLFVNPLFFLLSFTSVPVRVNRVAIIVGGLAGAVAYQVIPDFALLIAGLGFGTLVYTFDYLRRRRNGLVV